MAAAGDIMEADRINAESCDGEMLTSEICKKESANISIYRWRYHGSTWKADRINAESCDGEMLTSKICEKESANISIYRYNESIICIKHDIPDSMAAAGDIMAIHGRRIAMINAKSCDGEMLTSKICTDYTGGSICRNYSTWKADRIKAKCYDGEILTSGTCERERESANISNVDGILSSIICIEYGTPDSMVAAGLVVDYTVQGVLQGSRERPLKSTNERSLKHSRDPKMILGLYSRCLSMLQITIGVVDLLPYVN
ncbi:uncharacterized protein TRIADDRAFT_61284 [Trichoplax adhaerens]|uniref:Uncharacterized protein n=1 Tax=Trichoplax adhaerens TaxID=10228 RepID=B3SAJ7_TRIAD|nr:predicted protein [Trichoplax adhaerens]EDV20272.1 predicted protein [Trichoplax adhaerens]|eukprot:XP_002117222.1 predicted protein [Trichoplax adhaerens]